VNTYPMQEGTFFGNILITGAMPGRGTGSAPVAYYCDGASFPGGATGVVAGRIGANQSGAIYKNPFGNGVLCQKSGNNVPYYSKGASGQPGPDGYQKLEYPTGSPWNNPITVWRNATYTPSFDTGYSYRMMPKNANDTLAVDVNGSSLAQMTVSTSSSTQPLSIQASGSNWKIVNRYTGKCLDLNGGATAAYTQISLAACSGSASQSWSVTPDTGTGAFYFKNVASGRCLGNGNSSGAYQPLWILDCETTDNSQKFDMQGF
jgi:hypothetical protein